MTIETLENIVECLCSVATQGLMDSLPGKLLYVYILNMASKQVN